MYVTPSNEFRTDAGGMRPLRRRIIEKPWGRTDLPAAFGDFGDRRIGEIWLEHPDRDDTPVMVKFLFTSERLSVQVHPGEADARAAGLASGKDECWLVLAADPGAELGVGLRATSDAASLRKAAQDGSITQMVDWRSALADDFIYNPAGTIHALGGGLMIVEVQQNVDCTYRLYDYGRPRELHLEKGLKVATAAPVRDPRDTRVAMEESRKLVNGPHFHVLHLSGQSFGDLHSHMPEPMAGELTFVPLTDGCAIATQPVALGEAVLIEDINVVELCPESRALLCWPA